jgi:transposase-like protein
MARTRELKRRQESEWRQLIGEYERSGESLAVYCRRLGVRDSTFKWWRWRLGVLARESGPASEWISFDVLSSASRPSFELKFPDGRQLSIPSDFEAASLGRLLGILESGRC